MRRTMLIRLQRLYATILYAVQEPRPKTIACVCVRAPKPFKFQTIYRTGAHKSWAHIFERRSGGFSV